MNALKKFFRPFNIFTVLMIVAGFAFAFRLVNLMAFTGKDSSTVGAIMPAGAQEASEEEPPPMNNKEGPLISREELKKAVEDTARKADALEGAEAAAEAKSDPAADVPPPPDDSDVHTFTAAEIEVLQSLSKRRDDLDRREKRIAEKEALLSAAGQEVDHKITELNRLKGEIEALLGKQQKMEEDRLVSLVKIYEGMKPKEAATIFNTLDLDVLLAVIGRMNERKASPILASMEPEKARIVTIRLSEQEKLPKENQPAPAGDETSPAP